MDEIHYWRDGTLEKYTPSGDYVVVKFARWAFEKFEGVKDRLGTQMCAVGEAMSIGKNYKEAFQKAIRSLEILQKTSVCKCLTVHPKGTSCRAPGVRDQVFQRYISMLEGLIVDRWSAAEYLQYLNVFSSRAFLAIDNLETDPLPFFKCLITFQLDSGVVDKHVFAVILFDKTKSL